MTHLASLTWWLMTSYDLDQDTKLAEETTVLVESYTVRLPTLDDPSWKPSF
jgi:hypothetical protein